MQHQKKYSLMAEPREPIKNNDRARTFPQFQNNHAGYYYGH